MRYKYDLGRFDGIDTDCRSEPFSVLDVVNGM